MARRTAPKVSGSDAKPARKRASRSTTPSEETLAALDAATLIRLVLEETGINAAFRKRVSAALAGLQGADAVASLVDRRLAALEKARGFIDWQKRKAFAADLAAMLATIRVDLRRLDPGMALDRLVRFLAGAGGVLERVEDSSGQVYGLYETAAETACEIAAGLTPEAALATARALVPRLAGDGLGLLAGVVAALIPPLSGEALEAFDADLAAATPPLPARTRKGGAGVLDWETRLDRMRLIELRQAVADARGDVEAFIALETERSPERPNGAAIAERLIAAGRPQEALDWLRRPSRPGLVVLTRADMIAGTAGPRPDDRHSRIVEIAALEALGRPEEAQALRWGQFERGLDPQALRDYLARLPDFEDDEALARAFAHAAARTDPHGALYFFLRWPDLGRAARLVIDRRTEWEGRNWELLAPAAEALEPDHPLAASLLYRALIDDILERGRAPAYGHGARHLARLEALEAELAPGSLVPDHAAYREGLRRTHGRKSGFWSQVEG
ncbi:DUF6880 family protein [Methylobacterium organophilum]|uniref:Uncharacterized protein n=1 Tax=Methylobacterium organophilum TaxID=410 RepID=A0ABQ4T337_METOR|nr:DUF6880 family protein [Methylobacterium organophilum]GJE25391.1 hypothetical protein LKMONMHP_0228 [Methylobacterium organophilum]